METAIIVIHILVALGIIGLVLIQHGKGADAGAAFGAGAAGGASGSVFGAKGSSNFLSRATGILATLFFLSSLSLAYLAKTSAPEGSLLERVPGAETSIVEEQPAMQDSTDSPVIPEQGGASDTPETR